MFGPDEKAVPTSQKMHSESKWLHDKLSMYIFFNFRVYFILFIRVILLYLYLYLYLSRS